MPLGLLKTMKVLSEKVMIIIYINMLDLVPFYAS